MRKVETFHVVAVSDEFLEILRDVPEASTASSIQIGGRTIEGAKCVLKCRSMKEIEDNLPAIVKQLVDPEHLHLKIIHKSGWCIDCELQKGDDPYHF